MRLDENFHESNTEPKLSGNEIFTKIWFSPRLVFKYLNDNNYGKYVIIFLVLAGITNTFGIALTGSWSEDMSLMKILAICILFGGLFGWVSFYIFAALVSWTGRFLNGQGNTTSLLRMTSHAMIPSIVALLLLIPQIAAMVRPGIFHSELDRYVSGNAFLLISQIAMFAEGIFQNGIGVYGKASLLTIVFYATSLLAVILGLWTLVIFVIGVSEVQKFSIGKSIMNIILAALLILGPSVLIELTIGR